MQGHLLPKEREESPLDGIHVRGPEDAEPYARQRPLSTFQELPTYLGSQVIILYMTPKATTKGTLAHIQYTLQKALHRWNLKTERSDIMTKMADPDNGITLDELIANTDTLILGGSETTATLLAGLTYYLVSSPQCATSMLIERSVLDPERVLEIL